MEETAIINNAETDPKKVLNWLAITNELPANVFAQCVNYFRYLIKDNTLTEEEKCIMAVYLYKMEVIPAPSGKHHGHAGKKNFLYDYYREHINSCSNSIKIELNEYINDAYNRNIERKETLKEQILMDKYPELYKGLNERRIEKKKVRKHR